jgi:hypothetical protein
MAQSSSPTVTPDRRVARPHPVERPGDACPGLSTIDGIDVDQPVTCAPHRDEHIADLIIARRCPGCTTAVTAPCCRGYWDHLGAGKNLCLVCGWIGPREAHLRIVEVLR